MHRAPDQLMPAVYVTLRGWQGDKDFAQVLQGGSYKGRHTWVWPSPFQ